LYTNCHIISRDICISSAHTKRMVIKFLIYGALGWFMEIIWTGLGSLLRRDFKLHASTSIWMLFIYGMAVFVEPVCDMMRQLPLIARGAAYVLCFFAIEFATGAVLKKARVCPWDYSGSKFNLFGLIRFDYAPVWFLAGLVFERVHFVVGRYIA